MKKLKLFTILALFVYGVTFISCSTDSSDSDEPKVALPSAPETIESGYIRINYKGSGDWNLWAWKDFDETEVNKCKNWPDGIKVMYQNGEFICWDLKLAEKPSVLGLIVVNDKGVKGAGDDDIFFYFPQRYNEIFLTDDGTIYIDSELTAKPVGLVSATLTSASEISLNIAGVNVSEKNTSLLDKNGAIVAISSYSNEKLTLASGIKETYSSIQPLTLSVKIDDTNTDSVQVGLKADLTEDWYGKTAISNINDMGLTLNGSTASFKMWAPLATKVSLVLFKDADAVNSETILENSTKEMNSSEGGFWTIDNVDVSSAKYYKYRIESGAESHDVADIWSKVGSVDSKASQIIDIDDAACVPSAWESEYVNPWASCSESKSYSESVIYEMHIRDWSKAIGKDGKFINLAESEDFINHIKDIGITHIQILPSFDYAQVNADSDYNWGYNPYNYNTPEGRYVQDMKDGADAVKQFRQFIKAVHDAGIAVNMDVVYNHTSGIKTGSLYDMTVPEYFYRMNSAGAYSNGSGCGNEIATNHVVVKQFVIDSLVHWMKDYHINGFRFDLMGLHETTTMKAIYAELSKIDPNVMIYGEPWTGGTSTVTSGVKKDNIDACTSGTTVNGVACFNDDFRNAIKGAEFGGFKKGHVQGIFEDDAINVGLLGSLKTSKSGSKKGFTNLLGRSLNYVECHDNYTLFDKLAISYLGEESYSGDLFTAIAQEGLAAVKAQDKLAAAYIFLAQGTPFINGGQEFLRTKQGDENSYQSSDSINGINLSFKETYSDVYSTYKGLIALRKANPAAFGANKEATAETVSEGVTRYTTGDFRVFFNATDFAVNIDVSGYSKVVDVTSGTPTDSEIVSSVPAKSFVILEK